MQKIIDKAIGVIQHELIRSIDEFYEKDELTQNKISKSWNLILHEHRETMVAVRKAEKKLEEKRRTK